MKRWLHHRMCDECGERMRPMQKCIWCGEWFQGWEQEQKYCRRAHGVRARRKRRDTGLRRVFIYRCDACTATFAYTDTAAEAA